VRLDDRIKSPQTKVIAHPVTVNHTQDIIEDDFEKIAHQNNRSSKEKANEKREEKPKK
jgi:hypothetical protein